MECFIILAVISISVTRNASVGRELVWFVLGGKGEVEGEGEGEGNERGE